MKFNRKIKPQIIERLFRGKIIVIYGARQVGKTTLCKEIMTEYPNDSVYFSCDEIDVRQSLTGKTSTELKSFLGNKKLVILDEAQNVPNIGITLKLLVDNYPEIQIIATGSSSFDLANNINEPLTGRKYEFNLYPLSIEELNVQIGKLEVERNLSKILKFGLYPQIFNSDDSSASEELVKEISSAYLFKDILSYQEVKNPELLIKLLQALALQVGNEVSFVELGNLLGVNQETIQRYINLLEKIFVIFRITPFSRNLRNELNRKRKIFFYDLGIRNALIQNFNDIDLRTDSGAIWENFCILERKKFLENNKIGANLYYWRDYSGQEVDLVQESNGRLDAFEFKLTKSKAKLPTKFLTEYPAVLSIINMSNTLDLINP